MTRPDYQAPDLLADVFPGTEDAPVPLVWRSRAGGVRSLWASPADPRWDVEVELWPDGEVQFLHSIRPRPSDRPESVQGYADTTQREIAALRATPEAANGNRGSL